MKIPGNAPVALTATLTTILAMPTIVSTNALLQVGVPTPAREVRTRPARAIRRLKLTTKL